MEIIRPERISKFLKHNFRTDASSVEFIGAGMFSQAFSFRAGQGDFIIRLNHDDADFRKDKFAYDHVSSPRLPIPKLIHLGQFNTAYYFAITERCPGRTLDLLDEETIHRILPHLFQTLTAVHSINVSSAENWGLLDAHGVGLFESWQDYLLSFYNQKFSFEWETLIDRTFLEGAVVEKFLQKMKDLLPYCPQEKYLVHGDFGFDNVLADGEVITGVLDWAEMRYGDFMYDVAYLDFWSKGVRYGDLFEEYYAKQDSIVPNFAERIVCYMLHTGLGGLAIAAITGNEREYIRVRERTRSALKPGRRSASDWTQ